MFVACAVTHSASQARAEVKPREAKQLFSLTDYPLTVSRDELSREEQSDEMLNPQYKQVVDNAEIQNRAQGYFIKEGVLLRKWSPHAGDCIGDPIVQVVVPIKFQPLVFKTAHNRLAGHAGIKKTYDRILRYFYWPCIKKDVAMHASSPTNQTSR